MSIAWWTLFSLVMAQGNDRYGDSFRASVLGACQSQSDETRTVISRIMSPSGTFPESLEVQFLDAYLRRGVSGQYTAQRLDADPQGRLYTTRLRANQVEGVRNRQLFLYPRDEEVRCNQGQASKLIFRGSVRYVDEPMGLPARDSVEYGNDVLKRYRCEGCYVADFPASTTFLPVTLLDPQVQNYDIRDLSTEITDVFIHQNRIEIYFVSRPDSPFVYTFDDLSSDPSLAELSYLAARSFWLQPAAGPGQPSYGLEYSRLNSVLHFVVAENDAGERLVERCSSEAICSLPPRSSPESGRCRLVPNPSDPDNQLLRIEVYESPEAWIWSSAMEFSACASDGGESWAWELLDAIFGNQAITIHEAHFEITCANELDTASLGEPCLAPRCRHVSWRPSRSTVRNPSIEPYQASISGQPDPDFRTFTVTTCPLSRGSVAKITIKTSMTISIDEGPLMTLDNVIAPTVVLGEWDSESRTKSYLAYLEDPYLRSDPYYGEMQGRPLDIRCD